ncbi:MAG: hypothetical protein E7256_11270 [Lachnospiraceae bacterium]|nr:hypothetical protein [Lachnospiraceae bacterium]
MLNPTKLFKIKGAWDRFVQNHPKFPMFLQAINRGAIREGSIVEIKVTTPEGKEISSNVKVTASDIELFQEISEMAK